MSFQILKVKIKKLQPHAIIPEYSRKGDACLDLIAIDCHHNTESSFIEYGTGLAIKIPENHVGLLYPRSSISKTCHSLRNSVGVIDENYTGEIKFRFSLDSNSLNPEYNVGDRIGQLMIIPIPYIILEETEELPLTNRGTNGFGSSGN